VALELIQVGLRKKADYTYGKIFSARHARAGNRGRRRRSPFPRLERVD